MNAAAPREINAQVFSDPAACMPHQGRMVFLEKVVEHTAERIVCRTSTEKLQLVAASDGSVSVTAGIELIAQASALYAGLRAGAAAETAYQPAPTPKRGMLIGVRKAEANVPCFAPRCSLTVCAELEGTAGGSSAFSGAVYDEFGALLFSARIHVVIVNEEGQ